MSSFIKLDLLNNLQKWTGKTAITGLYWEFYFW